MRTMSFIVFSLLFMTQSFAAELIQCEAGTNMLAKNIYGLWQYDAIFSESVGDKDNNLLRIEFFPDETVLDLFAPANSFLEKDTCVYAAGYMNFFLRDKFFLGRPFVLIAQNGAPILFWLESYGEIFKSETSLVAFAAGADDSLDRFIVDPHPDQKRAMKFFKR